MKRLGPLRVGQGFALVFRSRSLVVGLGSKEFYRQLADEVGVPLTDRRHFPKGIASNDQWDHLAEDHEALD